MNDKRLHAVRGVLDDATAVAGSPDSHPFGDHRADSAPILPPGSDGPAGTGADAATGAL